MRHAMPQPADSCRGTGVSLPGMPLSRQNASISIAASVDASCEAHAALLRERADDERRDQRKDNGRVLAAGALGAHGVNAGRRADDEQSGEQDRQDCAAQRLRLIGAAEREALL